MICNFSKIVEKAIKNSTKKGIDTLVDSTAKALNFNYEVEEILNNEEFFNSEFELFYKTAYKDKLLRALYSNSFRDYKYDDYHFIRKGKKAILDKKLHSDYSFIADLGLDITNEENYNNREDFKNAMKSLYRNLLEKALSKNYYTEKEDSVPIKNNIINVTNNDLAETEESVEKSDFDEKIDTLSLEKLSVDKFGILDEDVFINAYFEEASELYTLEYSPYVKSLFKNALFNNIFKEGENPFFSDIKADTAENIRKMLGVIASNLNIEIETKPIINDNFSKLSQRISKELTNKVETLLKVKIAETKNIKGDIDLYTTPITEFNNDLEIKQLYYNYILLKEFNTSIQYHAGFVKLSKNKFGEIEYVLNTDIKNRRTDPNDSKNGTDQNSEFIKSVIESSNRLVYVKNLTEVELENSLSSNLIKEFNENDSYDNLYDFLINEKGIEYVIDKDNPFISYNEYNLVSIHKDFLTTNKSIEDVINFTNNKESSRASLYSALYSDKPVKFYNTITGQVEVQYSLLRLSKELSLHSNFKGTDENGDDIFDIKGESNPLINQVLIALTSDFQSRVQRVHIDEYGYINERFNNDIKYDTLFKLNSSLVKSLDDDILSPALQGKVSIKEETITENGEDFNRIVLSILTNNGDIIKLPLREVENVYSKSEINDKAMLVSLDRSQDTGFVNNNIFIPFGKQGLILKQEVINTVLDTLNFPKELYGNLKRSLNVDLKHIKDNDIMDLSNFVTNLAVTVALNKGSDNIKSNILERLGLNLNTLVTKKDLAGTNLKYDPYELLWKSRNEIVKLETDIKGLNGDTQIRTSESGKINVVGVNHNENLGKFISQLQELGKSNDNIGFAKNDLVTGKVIFSKMVFKTGITDYIRNRIVPLKKMTEHDKIMQNNEKYFLENAIKGNGNRVVVQLFANDRTIPSLYEFILTGDNKAIPLDSYGNINFGVLRDRLKGVKKNSLDDAQSLVLNNYLKVFNIDNKDLINKMIDVYPDKSIEEIGDIINSFNKGLALLEDQEDISIAKGINLLLRENDIRLDLMDIIEEIPDGIHYQYIKPSRRGKNQIVQMNEQFILDIDLWNDNINENNGYGDMSITLDEYLNDLFRRRRNYLSSNTKGVKYIKAQKSSVKALNKYIKELYPDSKKNYKAGDAAIDIDKAQHYNFLIFDQLVNPIRMGDLYKYMEVKTLKEASKEVKGGKNAIIRSINRSHATGIAARSKRDSILTSGGKSQVYSTNPETGLAVGTENEYDITFDEVEDFVETLGSLKGSDEPINDGAQYIMPEAVEMRSRSFGELFSYKVSDTIIKDVNYISDLKNRNSTVDKKATHPIFTSNAEANLKYDALRRFRETMFLSEDKSSVKVLVPNVNLLVDQGSFHIDYTVAKYVEFKTVQDLMDYLGGSLNENLIKDFVDILLLKENFNIRDKYISTLSFMHTRKTGSNVINKANKFNDKNSKVYTQKVNISGSRLILDLNKNVLEQHDIAMPTQSMQAALGGIVSKADGVELFKAIGNLYSLNYLTKMYDFQNTTNNILVNPEIYLTSKNETKNKELILSNIREIYNDLNEVKDSSLFIEIAKKKDTKINNEENYYRTALQVLLRSYILDNLKKNINNKANNDAILYALNNGSNINGLISAMYQSQVRTEGDDSLAPKFNGIDNVATPFYDVIKVYDNGEEVNVKSRMFEKTEKVLSNEFNFNDNINFELDNLLRDSNFTLITDNFHKRVSDIKDINWNEATPLLEEVGYYTDDNILVINFNSLKSDSKYDTVISIINDFGNDKKIFIFDNNDNFINDADLIITENNDIINKKGIYKNINAKKYKVKSRRYLTDYFIQLKNNNVIIEC